MAQEPDRGAIRARVEQIRRLWRGAIAGRAGATRDVQDLLAAYDVQEERMAALQTAVANAEEHFKVLPGQTSEADILDAYPCASPTCQAEQCVLGRKIEAQAARLAEIWVQVALWEQGTEGGLETLERLVALKETGCVD